MPRYHFHVHDSRSYDDDIGADLPDMAAARAYALRYFGQMLETSRCAVWHGDEVRMEVVDGSGLTLFTLYCVGIDAPAAGIAPEPDIITATTTQP